MSEIDSYAGADMACVSRGVAAPRRKIANNTWIERRPADDLPREHRIGDMPALAVRLHSTDIVTYYPDGSIRLDTGGWRTVTTKDRINRFSPFGIASERGVWKVAKGVGGRTVRRVESRWGDYNVTTYTEQPLFSDGMILEQDMQDGAQQGQWRVRDTPERAGIEAEVKADIAMKDEIAKYVRSFKIDADDLGAGDCFMCRMDQDKAGPEHLAMHVQERYYQWAVIFNAARFVGYPNLVYYPVIMTDTDRKTGAVRLSSTGRRTVCRFLSRHLLRVTATV